MIVIEATNAGTCTGCGETPIAGYWVDGTRLCHECVAERDIDPALIVRVPR